MPMTYARRAEYRADGWSEFRDTTRSTTERQAGLRNVIEADYEKSREVWKGARKRRPHGDWQAYAASWLFTRLGDPDFDNEVMAPRCAPSFRRPGRGLRSGFPLETNHTLSAQKRCSKLAIYDM
jgi:hypothetical protein